MHLFYEILFWQSNDTNVLLNQINPMGLNGKANLNMKFLLFADMQHSAL